MTLQPSFLSVQAVNDIGNLLSFVFLVSVVVLVVTIGVRRARRKPVRSLVTAAVACVATYAVALLAVSLSSRTRELAPGTEKCFDDWCATVTSAQSLPIPVGASGKLVAIGFDVANRAQRAAFRPSQPRVFLTLPDGRSFPPSPAAQRAFEQQAGLQESLSTRLIAGERFHTILVFEVPPETREGRIVLLEGPATITGFLIGDENSFLHAKLVFPVHLD